MTTVKFLTYFSVTIDSVSITNPIDSISKSLDSCIKLLLRAAVWLSAINGINNIKFNKCLVNKADRQSYTKGLGLDFPPWPQGISCNILPVRGEQILPQKMCVFIFILNTERDTKYRNWKIVHGELTLQTCH